ncbi:MAG: sugar ABC transporter permease [Ardenticatenaceae bacterium]|nr:sugar ABC transporter permease [Ardenticatenaceae bacterium]
MISLSIRQRQVMWAYIFLFVPMLFFIFIRIMPTLSAFNISLHDWNPLAEEQTFVGLANYQQLWEDLQDSNSVTRKAFVNTFQYVIVGMPLQLVIALGIALLLNEIKRFSTFFRAVYFLPFVTSTVAISWVWRWLYQPQYGFFNVVLSFFGLSQQPFLKHPDQALYSITAVVVWQGLGFAIIIFLAGLKQIPQIYYEAAIIDGATRLQKFRYVTIPLLNTTLVYLAVLQTISFLRMFDYVINMTTQGDGGPLGSTTTVTLRVYREAFSSFDMGYASALTVALFAIILVITIIQLRLFSTID